MKLAQIAQQVEAQPGLPSKPLSQKKNRRGKRKGGKGRGKKNKIMFQYTNLHGFTEFICFRRWMAYFGLQFKGAWSTDTSQEAEKGEGSSQTAFSFPPSFIWSSIPAYGHTHIHTEVTHLSQTSLETPSHTS